MTSTNEAEVQLKKDINKNLATILTHSPKGVEFVIIDYGGQERFRKVSNPLKPILPFYDFTVDYDENIMGDLKNRDGVLNIAVAPKLDIVLDNKEDYSFPEDYLVLPVSYNKQRPYNIAETALAVLGLSKFVKSNVGENKIKYGLLISFVGKGASGKTTTGKNICSLLKKGEPYYVKDLRVTTLDLTKTQVSFEGLLVLQKYIIEIDDAIYLSKDENDWYGIIKEGNSLKVYNNKGEECSIDIIDLVEQEYSFNMVDALFTKFVKNREEYESVLNSYRNLYPN